MSLSEFLSIVFQGELGQDEEERHEKEESAYASHQPETCQRGACVPYGDAHLLVGRSTWFTLMSDSFAPLVSSLRP